MHALAMLFAEGIQRKLTIQSTTVVLAQQQQYICHTLTPYLAAQHSRVNIKAG